MGGVLNLKVRKSTFLQQEVGVISPLGQQAGCSEDSPIKFHSADYLTQVPYR
jgi:hypothetical protein